MIEPSFLVLFLFSIIFANIVWLGAVYLKIGGALMFATLYGVVFPIVFASLMWMKSILCKQWMVPARIPMCPIEIGFRPVIRPFLASYSLCLLFTVLILAMIEKIPMRAFQIASISFPTLIYVIGSNIAVGTMEEAVFRKGIPEVMGLLSGGGFLAWSLGVSFLFGILHLYAYGWVIATVTAMVAGMVNSIIYYGYLPFAEGGSLTALALAHALYNITAVLVPSNYIVTVFLPLSFICILALVLVKI